MTLPRIPLSLLATTVAMAGCGGGDDQTDNSSEPTSPAPAASTSESSATGDVAIPMKDFQFEPASATVKVGQKVTWTNEDSAAHNVVSTGGDAGELKSKTMNQGDTYSFTAEKAGTIEYVCTFHPNMKAALTIE